MDGKSTADVGSPQQTGNAGLVLLSPFLPRLFHLLGLTEAGLFKGREAQKRGILALQYAAYGDAEATGSPIVLNRILTGIQEEFSLYEEMKLTDAEMELIDTTLLNVIQYWEKLKKSTLSAFRMTFLERDGILEKGEESFLLKISYQPYDLLLDSLPWSYTPVDLPWMEMPLTVEWR